MKKCILLIIIVAQFTLAYLSCSNDKAEDGYSLWMRYEAIDDFELVSQYKKSISEIVVKGESATMDIVRRELETALNDLLGQDISVSDNVTGDGSVLVGTPSSYSIIGEMEIAKDLKRLGPEGYIIHSSVMAGKNITIIAANTDIGTLYGTFHFLRLIQTHVALKDLNIAQGPKIQHRLLNHWDNIFATKYGTVERGYAGETLWKWDELPKTIDPRYEDYGRANASLGINGLVLNNVNSEPQILMTEYLEKVAALANVFRPYGIRVYVSANYSAPLPPSDTPREFKKWGGIGHLKTADPLDPDVIKWWKKKVAEIYQLIPDFGGFLVKANSENMPGPQDYGRNHTDGANMLAEVLEPYGGIVMWRAFVYNPEVDPDRAKRAYKEFVPLDGQFNPNVFIQPKNGPLDFQPLEPCHPIFGAMPETPLLMELQITQEYLGEDTYLVYLAPMWKKYLDFDTYAHGKGSTVAKIIDGSLHDYSMTGIAGVANTGSDRNWCGHHFAQANWFAFGRLSWDYTQSAESIADEWIRMTWGNDDQVVDTIKSIMLKSWKTSLNYMTPLGLTYTIGRNHYDPDPQNRNHQFWIADSAGLGYDRTDEGSNAVKQYFSPVKEIYNDIQRIPEDYVCYFHKVNWDHKMHSGRTFWEELCYRYYDGFNGVAEIINQWKSLKGKVDEGRYQHVLDRLLEQQAHAKIWRDTCVGYFHEVSRRPLPEYLMD